MLVGDLEDKSWPIIGLEREWEAKVRMISLMRNCVTSEQFLIL